MADNIEDKQRDSKIKEECPQAFGIPTQNIDQAEGVLGMYKKIISDKNNTSEYISQPATNVTDVNNNNNYETKNNNHNVKDITRECVDINTECATEFSGNYQNTNDYTADFYNIAPEGQVNVNTSSKINLQTQLDEDICSAEECGPSAISGFENIRHEDREHVASSSSLNNVSSSKSLQEMQSDCDIKDINTLQELSVMPTSSASTSFNMTFTNKQNFQLPELHNTEENPHGCKLCTKSFSKLTYLNRHVQNIHTRIAKHLCKYCNKGFAYLNLLKVHLRTHTGENPHSCEICKKTFLTSLNLKVHRRTHN